jgi:hypothetical protein
MTRNSHGCFFPHKGTANGSAVSIKISDYYGNVGRFTFKMPSRNKKDDRARKICVRPVI